MNQTKRRQSNYPRFDPTENSIAVKSPDIVYLWHPTKNGALTPDQVAWKGGLKVWWQCPAAPDHEWFERTRTHDGRIKCPFCANERVSSDNNLAALNPKIAKNWHNERNHPLTARDVVPGSNKKVWWRCPEGHEWQQMVLWRVQSPRSCPTCEAPPPAMRKLDWKCAKGHSWQQIIRRNIPNPKSCPTCAKAERRAPGTFKVESPKKATPTNNLALRLPQLAQEWHPTKNGKLRPTDVLPGSRHLVWWQCPKEPAHEWECKVSSRSRGINCHYCGGHRVKPEESLAALNPPLAKQWHPSRNGDLQPDQITPRSSKKVWWLCPLGPDHEWEMSADRRTIHGPISNCPFCSNWRVSVTNSVRTRAPKLVKEWHPTKNGELTPDNVVATAARLKLWWRCAEGHEWQADPYSRITLHRGCQVCRLPVPRRKNPRVLEPDLIPADFEPSGRDS